MRCAVGVAGWDQTEVRFRREVTNPHLSRTALERRATEGDSPVDEKVVDFLDPSPKYYGALETLWESRRTISQG